MKIFFDTEFIDDGREPLTQEQRDALVHLANRLTEILPNISKENLMLALAASKGMFPAMDKIDLQGHPGDVRFECPVCHWTVTLTAQQARMWTEGGKTVPICANDRTPLTQTIIEGDQ